MDMSLPATTLLVDDIGELDSEDMFIEQLPEYLRCPVCLCCLNNPHQTPCGHRFCKDCILPIMTGRNAACPIDRSPIDAASMFPDNAAKLQINCLKVRCTMEGCDWEGEYSDRINHRVKCSFILVPCEFCKTKICKAEFKAHMPICPQRKVQCEFCKIEIPLSELDQHLSECSEYLVTCEKGCSTKPIPRKHLAEHYQVCPAVLVPCSMAQFGCVEQVERGSLAKHVVKCGPRHASRMAELVLTLQRQMTELSAKVDAQQERVQYLECILYPCAGQFTWRIDAIREKIKAAQAGDAAASLIYSPSFYSCESGYKICLCVYPAGDNHEGYLSLYFVLMKGQFDEVLPWPFGKRVILSLLSCRGVHPIIKDIHPDPRMHYFSRPESLRNVGYGYPKFIALQKLLGEDSEYVENGVIFLRATVYP